MEATNGMSNLILSGSEGIGPAAVHPCSRKNESNSLSANRSFITASIVRPMSSISSDHVGDCTVNFNGSQAATQFPPLPCTTAHGTLACSLTKVVIITGEYSFNDQGSESTIGQVWKAIAVPSLHRRLQYSMRKMRCRLRQNAQARLPRATRRFQVI